MSGPKKWNMVMDLARCHDCNNCFLACKDEFVGNDFPPYAVAQPWAGQRWINILRAEGGQYPKVQANFLTLLCQQCDKPSCTTPDGAVYKRDDGIVIIDPQKAAGRKEIVDSCPYGAIYWNEEKNVAQKCIGCAHLLDAGWKEPRCTQVCPTDALKLMLADDEEMTKVAAEQGLEYYHPEYGARPRVYYKNLHRWTNPFLAGNVVFGDTDECAQGASVRISRGAQVVAEATADEFGDFMIEKLQAEADYEVSVNAAGYQAASVPVRLQKSLNIGSVILKKQ